MLSRKAKGRDTEGKGFVFPLRKGGQGVVNFPFEKK